MPSKIPTATPLRWALTTALLAVGIVANGQDEPVTEAPRGDLHQLYYGAYLPRDRTASRSVRVAESLISQERYGEAAPLLLSVLRGETDVVEESAVGRVESLRRRAAEVVAGLPAAGRWAYLLEAEAEAERELAEQLAGGDAETLAELRRRYPGTNAADTSLWFQAVAWLDRGETELALAALKRLGDSPNRDDFEPQRSLMAIGAALQQGDSKLARALAGSLSRSTWAGESLPGIESLADPEAVVASLNAAFATNASSSAYGVATGLSNAWPRVGGNRRGNPVCSLGQPHMWAEWSAMTEIDPRRVELLQSAADHLRGQGRVTAPAGTPVVAAGLVLFRTGEGLVAVDRESGRRLWQTHYGGESAQTTAASHGAVGRLDANQKLIQASVMRAFFDQVLGQLATDGVRAYAVETTRATTATTVPPSPFARFSTRGQPSYRIGGNRLAAYDLASEGKLLWRCGGEDLGAAQPATFLSSPLPLGGTIVVAVEQRPTISLVELDAATGRVSWTQPLVSVERGVDQSLRRRLLGASLASKGGLVVCSTGAGVVVAVDLLDRSLAWLDRFPVDTRRQTPAAAPWRGRARETWPRNSEDGWGENRVIIGERRVFVAAPESPLLHCLELETGLPIWRVDRGGAARLVASVGDCIIVAAADQLRCHDEAGDVAWTAKWPTGPVLSGRPVVADGVLTAPLSDASLLQIDATTGEEIGRRRLWTGPALGNLAVDGESVFSQTPFSLERYRPEAPLLAAAGAELEADPNNAVALRLRGEKQLVEGTIDAAVDSLGAALDADPGSLLLRARLRQALTMRGQRGPARVGDLQRLEQLAQTGPQRAAAALRSTTHAASEGQLAEAAEAALRVTLAAPTSPIPSQLAPGRYATPAARAAGVLGRAWQAGDAAQAKAAKGAIEAALQANHQTAERLALARLALALPSVEPLDELREQAAKLHDQLAATQPDDEAADQVAGERLASPTDADRIWATRGVAVERTQRERTGNQSSRQTPLGRRATTVVHAGGAAPAQALAIDLDSAELLGADAAGDTLFSASLGDSGRAFLDQARGSRQDEIWTWGGRVYLPAGDHVQALQPLGGRLAGDLRLWSSLGLVDRLAAAHWQAERTSLTQPDSNPGVVPTAPVRVLSVSDRGVLVLKRDALLCFDPIDGHLRWLRSDKRFTKSTAADSRHVYCVTQDREPLRLSLTDGETLSAWQAPAGQWVAARRGLLTTHETDAGAVNVRTTRLATGEELLNHPSAINARVARVEDWGHALLEPDGRFCLIDLSTGEKLVQTRLTLREPPRQLIVESRSAGVVVLVGYASASPQTRGRSNTNGQNALLTGDVFCLDPETGDLRWLRPAAVAGVQWLQRQPASSSLLVFARQRKKASGMSGAKGEIDLMVLDALTGRIAAEVESLPATALASYRMRCQSLPVPRQTIMLDKIRVILTATDRPVSPSPPPAAPPAESLTDPGSNLFNQMRQGLEGLIRPQAPPLEDEED